MTSFVRQAMPEGSHVIEHNGRDIGYVRPTMGHEMAGFWKAFYYYIDHRGEASLWQCANLHRSREEAEKAVRRVRDGYARIKYPEPVDPE